MMIETYDIQKRYCSLAMAVAIVGALIFIAVDAKPIAKGLVLGTLFSIINFIIMAATLPMRLDKSRQKTFMINIGGIGSRYLLLGIPLLIAINMDAVNFFSTAAGLFMVQGVLVGHHFAKLFLGRD